MKKELWLILLLFTVGIGLAILNYPTKKEQQIRLQGATTLPSPVLTQPSTAPVE